jgi:hypothetical protein
MQRCRDESSQVRLSQPLQQLLDPQLPRAFSLSNEDDGFGTSSCAPLSSTQHLSSNFCSWAVDNPCRRLVCWSSMPQLHKMFFFSLCIAPPVLHRLLHLAVPAQESISGSPQLKGTERRLYSHRYCWQGSRLVLVHRISSSTPDSPGRGFVKLHRLLHAGPLQSIHTVGYSLMHCVITFIIMMTV